MLKSNITRWSLETRLIVRCTDCQGVFVTKIKHADIRSWCVGDPTDFYCPVCKEHVIGLVVTTYAVWVDNRWRLG